MRTMRATLVVVVLLLVPAVAGGVVPGPDPRPAATTGGEDAPINRIAHLTLGEESSEGITNQSVDVAAAVSVGRDDAGARLADYALAERLNRTNRTNAELDARLEEIESRMNLLGIDARAVRTEYADGSAGPSEFVHESAHIQARAVRLDDRLSRLEGLAERYGNATHRAKIDRLEERLIGHAGPVRRRALAAIAGRRASIDLYAAGSDAGVVFATIAGSMHVRDAYRADRKSYAPDGISVGEADQRLTDELYAVAFGFSGRFSIAPINGDNTTYRFEKSLPFGSLLAYLDSGTEEVFHEVQRRDLEALDQPASVITVENGTRLIVNRSYTGGPLRIATRDADGGAATESTIRVGDRRLETGADGEVWTLMPPGSSVEVTATTPDGIVTATVEPLTLTPVNGSSGS